jgi:ribosomal subunit interface protein
MSIQVTGKNIETGAALQDYIEGKVGEVLNKYIGPELGGHVRIEKERGVFRTSCSIRLRTGLLLESQGEGPDAYASADAAIERLDKRVRRYKRRLKNHHSGVESGTKWPEETAADYVVGVPDDVHEEALFQAEDAEPAGSVALDHVNGAAEDHAAPLIVAETTRVLRELPVSAAVMQLDLTDEPFLLFRNAGTGTLNIVYRRADGHIGWVDPASLT